MNRVLDLHEAMSVFPSLGDAPRELHLLEVWFDSGGPTEQATHAAAFVLQRWGVPDIEFCESEALIAWDDIHRSAYRALMSSLAAAGAR